MIFKITNKKKTVSITILNINKYLLDCQMSLVVLSILFIKL